MIAGPLIGLFKMNPHQHQQSRPSRRREHTHPDHRRSSGLTYRPQPEPHWRHYTSRGLNQRSLLEHTTPCTITKHLRMQNIYHQLRKSYIGLKMDRLYNHQRQQSWIPFTIYQSCQKQQQCRHTISRQLTHNNLKRLNNMCHVIRKSRQDPQHHQFQMRTKF